ncbi:hypothetical protein IAD21_02290 [Abditibacteriota bacterium]|nr:hypothetical protein IAD21_02290 [Abditibacteriota bacterium]
MNLELSTFASESAKSPFVQNILIAYEAPAIESVLTPESLEREVHYADLQANSGPVTLMACF